MSRIQYNWTAVCEECEHEWENAAIDDEHPERCPLCHSEDILVEDADLIEEGDEDADVIEKDEA